MRNIYRSILGVICLLIALLSAAASAVIGGPLGNPAGMLFAALANPILWIGLLVGSWLLGLFDPGKGNTVVFYFKDKDGIIFGPYTSENIIELTARGTIESDTLISRSTSGPWRTSISLMEKSSHTERRYYKASSGDVVGPLTSDEILAATTTGVIHEETPISISQNGPWKRSGELRRF